MLQDMYKKKHNILKSQTVVGMDAKGKEGSQNKWNGVSKQLPQTKQKHLFTFVFFFGIFSYFYTSAKWIIETDEYHD